MKNKQKVVAIVGATATGKTNYAVDYALKNNGEIISADSRLVYKGFDIAAAKPTESEKRGIKHYLIDVAEPEYDYSVANFYDEAKAAITEISNKGKLPIVAGGTGLYFRILLEDFDLPRVSANYKLREELEKKDTLELHAMLSTLDKERAEKIHPNNKVKIIRAIEVCKALDKPMTISAGKKEPEYEVEWIGLNYQNREDLYARIEKRVDEMVEKGIVEETEKLLACHGRIPNFINTIGYKEILKYLDGEQTLEESISELKLNTRHYAKRQLTWFRRNEKIKWIYRV